MVNERLPLAQDRADCAGLMLNNLEFFIIASEILKSLLIYVYHMSWAR